MPVEVVDLVSSSPDLPPPKKTAPVPKVAASTASARLSSITQSSTRARSSLAQSTKVDDAWLATSDPFEDLSATKPVARPASKDLATASNSVFAAYKKDIFDFSDDDPFASDGSARKRRRVEAEKKENTTDTFAKKGTGLKRATSAADNVSSNAVKRSLTEKAGLKRSHTVAVDSDPIMFTSSPDVFAEAAQKKQEPRKQSRKLDDIEDLEDEDDPFGDLPAGPMANTTKPAGGRSTATGGSTKARNSAAASKDPLDIFSSDDDSSSLPDIGQISASQSYKTSPKKSRKSTSKSALDDYNASRAKDLKAREKATKAAEKAAAKAVEKEQKLREKEEKKREKEIAAELAKVNTLKVNKKDSTPEMLVDLPEGLDAALSAQLRQFFDRLSVTVEEKPSPVPNVIRWRRTVEAKMNEESGLFEPCAKHIEKEKHVLVVLNATDLVSLVQAPEGHDLDAHVLRMKTKFDDCAIIYLIEGINAWMRKNKNIRNRQFTAAVRNQTLADDPDATTLPPSSQRAAPRRKTKAKAPQEYINEDLIEDALLKLQVIHGTLIHHTATSIQTAEQIVSFTQHLSTKPYRLAQLITQDSMGFCMESGQIKSGVDAEDTYVRMLQEVTRITKPIALGIAREFPSVYELVQGLREGGETALQDCRKHGNVDGAFSDRKVGSAISKRVWRIFMGEDENSLVFEGGSGL